MRERLHDERGGVLLKALLVVFIVIVGASMAFYWYAGRQEPLALGTVNLDWNEAVEPTVTEDGGPPAVAFVSGGRLYVATFLKNTGRLPLTLEGLERSETGASSLYAPAGMFRSDGQSTDPELASPFEPVSLDPGAGLGVLVVFGPNPELVCDRLPTPGSGGEQSIASFPVRFTSYGVPVTQQVSTDAPFVEVTTPTKDECRQVVAQAGG